jgi:hypothetical protein
VALNKLGLIVKTRCGVTKHRMILDTKQSRVKRATTQSQRVTLPRPFDAILHLLFLMTISMACAGGADGLIAFVLDFSDAFWQIPLLQAELRYYCATGLIHGIRKWIAFLRAPQGSSAAPTLWGRVAALLMRLTQSLFSPDEVRLVCYVDDPFAAVRGTPERRRLLITLMVLVWNALGFKLAFRKGQLGVTVTWIGMTVTIEQGGIRARVKQAIIDDILADLDAFEKENVISKKVLHSFLGKLSHVSGLLLVMRPFSIPIWAAWGGPSPDGKPGCIWASQIETETAWLRAFFTGKGATVERFFSLDAYNRVGTVVALGTDASPWGLGGWLAVDGEVREYFTSPISAADIAKYGYAIGDAAGQQLWEALAILVAVDLWASYWSQQRVILKVKGDNVAALVLLIKMRPKTGADGTPKMAIVARELALRLVDLSFPPDAEHTPGVSHKFADMLSRVTAPLENDGQRDGILPDDAHPAMLQSARVETPPRGRAGIA